MARLRHIALTVPDPEKAAKFYMEAFGLRRVGGTDWAGASGVYLSDGVVNIALLRYKTEEMAGERGRGFVGVHHFGFIVDDIDFWWERAVKAGAEVVTPVELMFWGARWGQVKDPFGVIWGFNEVKK